MAKPLHPDPTRHDLLRLLNGLEFYRAWVIESIRHARGEVTQDDLNQIVEPASSFLDVFDATDGKDRISILRDVQEWYSHTAGNFHRLMGSGDPALAADVKAFLAAFRDSVGFDFLEEAGLLQKTARKVRKAGRITSEADYYALRELEIDLSQAVIDPSDMPSIRALLRDYESRQASA